MSDPIDRKPKTLWSGTLTYTKSPTSLGRKLDRLFAYWKTKLPRKEPKMSEKQQITKLQKTVANLIQKLADYEQRETRRHECALTGHKQTFTKSSSVFWWLFGEQVRRWTFTCKCGLKNVELRDYQLTPAQKKALKALGHEFQDPPKKE